MQLGNLIGSAMGQAALAQIGQRVGLSPAQTKIAMEALMPAIAGGVKKQARDNPQALEATIAQAGRHDSSEAEARHGNEVLGTVFGSKDVSRTVAGHASAQTGIDADKLKALLPIAASLAAGALAKGGNVGGTAASGDVRHAPSDAPAHRAGGLLGMLDADGDGNPLDDILKMAGKTGLR